MILPHSGRRAALHVLASVLAAPAAYAQQAPTPVEARVHNVRNRVEVGAPHGATGGARPAVDNEVLAPGQQFVTHEDAEATIRYTGLGEFQVEERTHLVMFGPPAPLPASAPPVRETSITRGALRVLVEPAAGAPRDASIAVHTPGGTVHLTRGECRISVDASHATRVAVYRGRARVTAGQQGFLMGAGTATRIEAASRGVAVFPPLPVPRAPVWSQPFPARVIALGGSATVEGRYAPPPGQTQHQTPHGWVQVLARDAAFDDIVFERPVAVGETRFAAERLPEGVYFARVLSVDGERFESVPSAAQRFEVVAPRVIPGGPGRRAEVLAPAGLFCRLDDDVTLTAGVPVPLLPAHAHTLACATEASMQSPTRIEIPATQAGDLEHEARLDGAWTTAGGSAPVALRLRDASGRPYPYATVTARGASGVTVERVREEAERGLYVTQVSWSAGAPVTVEFVVNDAVRFTETLGGTPAAAPAASNARQ